MFGVLVTYLLDAVWHAILDNFRPITVWVVDLAIYYCVSKNFGEQDCWCMALQWFVGW